MGGWGNSGMEMDCNKRARLNHVDDLNVETWRLYKREDLHVKDSLNYQPPTTNYQLPTTIYSLLSTSTPRRSRRNSLS